MTSPEVVPSENREALPGHGDVWIETDFFVGEPDIPPGASRSYHVEGQPEQLIETTESVE